MALPSADGGEHEGFERGRAKHAGALGDTYVEVPRIEYEEEPLDDDDELADAHGVHSALGGGEEEEEGEEEALGGEDDRMAVEQMGVGRYSADELAAAMLMEASEEGEEAWGELGSEKLLAERLVLPDLQLGA